MDNRVASQVLSQERVISSSVRVRIVDMQGLRSGFIRDICLHALKHF